MLDLRQLDLNLLLAFDAIYHQRSITRAAEVMGLTQPAMSNALRQLCDDPLFIKTHLGVAPTLVAHRLSGSIREALDSLREALNHTPAAHAPASARALRISCPEVFQPTLLEALLESPDFDWQPRFYQSRRREALQELSSGKLDLLIDIDQPLSQQCGLRKLPLLEDEYVFAHGEALAQPPRTREDYLKLPQIQVSQRRDGLAPIDLELGLRGQRRHIALTMQSALAARLVADQRPYGLTLPSRVAELLGLRQSPLPLEQPVRIALCLYVENRYRFEQAMERAIRDVQRAFAGLRQLPRQVGAQR
ncbi:DNA-binding transcriptional LysR family regulator [Pseudomonas nitritireducens]|uniref:DNA-binding transcriptional LysR family regulator n=1 Tax=Pseudomonas nitroreducens TaxID=46680 RepID=A0A7W7KGL5_PSENT|nr:LysR family transcriptional regulator [Pseudomonas nitritireducens]MBB4861883.1 DNA-binding transcriptional LysR family regulator [Pseudomonas nitritireducens]